MTTFAQQMKAVHRNAEAHERRQLEATRNLLEQWATDATVYMRVNAPWTDQTGQARFGEDSPIDSPLPQLGDGLHWKAIHPRELLDGGAISLISDASYGVYLETKHGAKYAIILPTVATLGPELIERLRRIWR